MSGSTQSKSDKVAGFMLTSVFSKRVQLWVLCLVVYYLAFSKVLYFACLFWCRRSWPWSRTVPEGDLVKGGGCCLCSRKQRGSL